MVQIAHCITAGARRWWSRAAAGRCCLYGHVVAVARPPAGTPRQRRAEPHPPEVNATIAALTALCLQQGLFAVLWLVMAALRMARRATLHWAVGMMVITAGLCLIVQRDSIPRWLGFWVSGVALYGGFLLIKRGLNLFSRLPTRDAAHLAGLVAYAGALALATASRTPWVFVTVSSLPMAALQFTMGRPLLSVQAEVGRGLALTCALPFWLLSVIVCARGLLAPLQPERIGASMHGAGTGNLSAAFTFVVMGLMLNFVLVAVVCGRMVRRLERASDYDGLTGLLNRRAIEKHLLAQASRLARTGQPYSMLSIDLDHFKRVNDRHGHPVGDAVLRQFGRTLAEQMRLGDLAARAGGEEFWALLPDTDLAGAQALAERVQAAVRALCVPVRDGQVAITASMGVVVAVQPGEDLGLLMQRLDAALYRAKDRGRDCIEVADAAGADAAGDAPPAPAVPPAAAPVAADTGAGARSVGLSAAEPVASPGGSAP